MNNEELNKLKNNFAMLQQDNENRMKAEELRLKKYKEKRKENIVPNKNKK